MMSGSRITLTARWGKLPGRAQKPVEIFTPAELAHFLKTCLAVKPPYYPLLLLMARSWLRLGEALARQAGDVDMMPKPYRSDEHGA